MIEEIVQTNAKNLTLEDLVSKPSEQASKLTDSVMNMITKQESFGSVSTGWQSGLDPKQPKWGNINPKDLEDLGKLAMANIVGANRFKQKTAVTLQTAVMDILGVTGVTALPSVPGSNSNLLPFMSTNVGFENMNDTYFSMVQLDSPFFLRLGVSSFNKVIFKSKEVENGVTRVSIYCKKNEDMQNSIVKLNPFNWTFVNVVAESELVTFKVGNFKIEVKGKKQPAEGVCFTTDEMEKLIATNSSKFGYSMNDYFQILVGSIPYYFNKRIFNDKFIEFYATEIKRTNHVSLTLKEFREMVCLVYTFSKTKIVKNLGVETLCTMYLVEDEDLPVFNDFTQGLKTKDEFMKRVNDTLSYYTKYVKKTEFAFLKEKAAKGEASDEEVKRIINLKKECMSQEDDVLSMETAFEETKLDDESDVETDNIEIVEKLDSNTKKAEEIEFLSHLQDFNQNAFESSDDEETRKAKEMSLKEMSSDFGSVHFKPVVDKDRKKPKKYNSLLAIIMAIRRYSMYVYTQAILEQRAPKIVLATWVVGSSSYTNTLVLQNQGLPLSPTILTEKYASNTDTPAFLTVTLNVDNSIFPKAAQGTVVRHAVMNGSPFSNSAVLAKIYSYYSLFVEPFQFLTNDLVDCYNNPGSTVIMGVNFYPLSLNSTTLSSIYAYCVKYSDLVTAIQGNYNWQAGIGPSTWDTSTAVVILRPDEMSDGTANIVETLCHLEFPFKDLGWTSLGINRYSNTVAFTGGAVNCLASKNKIAGPTQNVLYVVMSTEQNAVVNLSDGTTLTTVSSANNHPFTGGVAVNIFATVNSMYGRLPTDTTTLIRTADRWTRKFGNANDYNAVKLWGANNLFFFRNTPYTERHTTGYLGGRYTLVGGGFPSGCAYNNFKSGIEVSVGSTFRSSDQGCFGLNRTTNYGAIQNNTVVHQYLSMSDAVVRMAVVANLVKVPDSLRMMPETMNLNNMCQSAIRGIYLARAQTDLIYQAVGMSEGMIQQGYKYYGPSTTMMKTIETLMMNWISTCTTTYNMMSGGLFLKDDSCLDQRYLIPMYSQYDVLPSRANMAMVQRLLDRQLLLADSEYEIDIKSKDYDFNTTCFSGQGGQIWLFSETRDATYRWELSKDTQRWLTNSAPNDRLGGLVPVSTYLSEYIESEMLAPAILTLDSAYMRYIWPGFNTNIGNWFSDPKVYIGMGMMPFYETANTATSVNRPVKLGMSSTDMTRYFPQEKKIKNRRDRIMFTMPRLNQSNYDYFRVQAQTEQPDNHTFDSSFFFEDSIK